MVLTVVLRPAELRDCRQVWLWRNEEGGRSASFNTDPIPYDQHVRWFSRKLGDPTVRCLIAVDASGQDVGCVRFDTNNYQTEISIVVARQERGKGYGTAAIVSAVGELLASEPAQRVIARVRPENRASLAAFERAGFTLRGTVEADGVTAYELVFERPAAGEME